MEKHSDEPNGHTPQGFLAGVLVGGLAGGLAGAGAMLLLAPQSGKRTRAQIRRKGVQLRDQTVDGLEDALEQAHETRRHISDNVHQQVEDLQQRGQEILDAQKERVAILVDAGKKVAKKGSGN